MFGVDRMDSKAVFQYFLDYGATYIEWLTVSSCKCKGGCVNYEGNVLFADEHTARRALVGLGKPVQLNVPKEGAKEQKESTEGTEDCGVGLVEQLHQKKESQKRIKQRTLMWEMMKHLQVIYHQV